MTTCPGAARRPGAGQWLRLAPPIAQGGIVAALFFAAAIGIAGLPPLSGFPGKLAVMQSVRDADGAAAIWAIILVSSLLAIAGLTRAGSLVFWKAHAAQDAPPPQAEPDEPPHDPAPTSAALALTATTALVAGIVALTVFAGPMMRYADATARQLVDPEPYIGAVLRDQEGVK